MGSRAGLFAPEVPQLHLMHKLIEVLLLFPQLAQITEGPYQDAGDNDAHDDGVPEGRQSFKHIAGYIAETGAHKAAED